jgi:hypothetical protein
LQPFLFLPKSILYILNQVSLNIFFMKKLLCKRSATAAQQQRNSSATAAQQQCNSSATAAQQQRNSNSRIFQIWIIGLLFFALSSNAYSQTLFALDIQVNKTPEGLFHIHLNPTGGGVDDGCYTQLKLQFDFLQVTPNVTDPCSPTIINTIYSTALKDNQGQDIKFFGSNEALLSEYFPMNGVFDYVISLPTCSLTATQIANINMVRITSNLYNGDCQSAQLGAYDSTLHIDVQFYAHIAYTLYWKYRQPNCLRSNYTCWIFTNSLPPKW